MFYSSALFRVKTRENEANSRGCSSLARVTLLGKDLICPSTERRIEKFRTIRTVADGLISGLAPNRFLT